MISFLFVLAAQPVALVCAQNNSQKHNNPENNKKIYFFDTNKKAREGYVQLKWKLDAKYKVFLQSILDKKALSSKKKKQDETQRQNIRYELQHSDFADFSKKDIFYRGPDRASFVSGLKQGKHYFRVRVITPGVDSKNMQTPWSQVHIVKVKYHSWTLTWILFFTGAFIFFVLVGLLIWGTKKAHRNQE